MTVLAAARIVTGDGGVSASPAFVVFEHGRIVATGTGTPPSGAVDLGDALAVFVLTISFVVNVAPDAAVHEHG